MISAYQMGTLGSVASLLEVTLYQGNPNKVFFASFSYRDRRLTMIMISNVNNETLGEWLLFISSFFFYFYHGENKLIVYDDDIRFVL